MTSRRSVAGPAALGGKVPPDDVAPTPYQDSLVQEKVDGGTDLSVSEALPTKLDDDSRQGDLTLANEAEDFETGISGP